MEGEQEASENIKQFEQRKLDHIKYAMSDSAQSDMATKLDMVNLIHSALPEMDFDEVMPVDHDPQAMFSSPFFVASMTAGSKESDDLNLRIAKACSKSGWAMAVGSQRRELFDPEERKRWQKIKEQYTDLIFLSNIGLSQAIHTSSEDLKALCDSLGASALIIHTNPLQEAIQAEGTPNFKNGLKSIERICRDLTIPVVLKETGCGFSTTTLKQLNDSGIFAVDISGLGGTHWGRIEGMRTKDTSSHAVAAETFSNWGISTVDSLLNAQEAKVNYRIWASGGIRNGLDAAKCFALGAKKVSFAKKILEAALVSSDKILEFMHQCEYELKIAMFCSGCKNFSKLQQGSNIVNYQEILRERNV